MVSIRDVQQHAYVGGNKHWSSADWITHRHCDSVSLGSHRALRGTTTVILSPSLKHGLLQDLRCCEFRPVAAGGTAVRRLRVCGDYVQKDPQCTTKPRNRAFVANRHCQQSRICRQQAASCTINSLGLLYQHQLSSNSSCAELYSDPRIPPCPPFSLQPSRFPLCLRRLLRCDSSCISHS